MELNWKKWEGKKAHIILENGYEYNCIVNAVMDMGNNLIFFDITDKFGEIKSFQVTDIKFIEGGK